MTEHGRWPLRTARLATLLLPLAATLAITGCDVPPTTGPGLKPDPALQASGSGGVEAGRFISNRVQYRRTGLKPAVGRAGSATLTASAFMDVTGGLELLVAAGGVAGGDPRLGLVQIKAFDPDGRLLYTRTDPRDHSTRDAEYVLGGVSRGSRLQVQANVQGAGLVRTGVVTLDVPIGLRPDLAVAAIAAPQRVALRSMVGISATIRELNGDFGARAHCALLVDEVEVDRAWGIWVDAGSAVSCAFRHRFDQLGVAQLEVRLLDVAPRDFDPSNNSASATVDVMLIPSAFAYSADFQDATFEDVWRSENSWQTADGRAGYESSDHRESSGREQHAGLWAWMAQGLTFPLDEVILQQMTRDETVHYARFLGVDADWSWSDEWGSETCLSRWFNTPNGYNSFDLCSAQWGGDAYTHLHYSRYAGEVTYHSRGDARWWDRDAGWDDAWSWNYDGTSSVGRMASYGHEYGFFIFIDDGGAIYRMQPLVWLHPFDDGYQSPWSCWEYDDEWGSSRGCHETRWRASGLRGWVDGWPTY